MLHLAYVGGLGLMASPAAVHLRRGGPARVLRVHDRGRPGASRDAARAAWRAHGAELVPALADAVAAPELDGVVVCCGKNGDDLSLIAELVTRLSAAPARAPFVVHMSTVSADFASAAAEFAAHHGVGYGNYPLTGGPLGAQRGGAHPQGMLILASGDAALYERLAPTLAVLGHPRYFGPRAAAGAETKLIGQHMVFAGCTGITSAAALHAECFAGGVLGGAAQAEYFDFLNGGAGGTRQWEVALGKGVRDGVWEQGFMVRHAVVDAIYAAQLAFDRGLPRFSIQPLVDIALAFAFLLHEHPRLDLATHAIARELVRGRARGLDAFLHEHGAFAETLPEALAGCIAALPPAVRATVRLPVTAADFAAAAAALYPRG
jgi:3-hydroxyisobutyrate dehydrogenase-like beta-hydroxyacid dehydrogenase